MKELGSRSLTWALVMVMIVAIAISVGDLTTASASDCTPTPDCTRPPGNGFCWDANGNTCGVCSGGQLCMPIQ